MIDFSIYLKQKNMVLLQEMILIDKIINLIKMF